jgi:hypothetical protein
VCHANPHRPSPMQTSHASPSLFSPTPPVPAAAGRRLDFEAQRQQQTQHRLFLWHHMKELVALFSSPGKALPARNWRGSLKGGKAGRRIEVCGRTLTPESPTVTCCSFGARARRVRHAFGGDGSGAGERSPSQLPLGVPVKRKAVFPGGGSPAHLVLRRLWLCVLPCLPQVCWNHHGAVGRDR